VNLGAGARKKRGKPEKREFRSQTSRQPYLGAGAGRAGEGAGKAGTLDGGSDGRWQAVKGHLVQNMRLQFVNRCKPVVPAVCC
jgi:hypothetical protein